MGFKDRKNKSQIKEVLDSIALSAKTGKNFKNGSKYAVIEEVSKKIKIKCFSGVIIVDCRGEEIPKGHNDFSLFSSEKAEYVLGFGDKNKFSTIVSVTGTGKVYGKTLFKSIKDAVKQFKRYEKDFSDASVKIFSLNGGGVIHRPAFIAICNYGYSIHGFSNQYLINSY